MSERLTPERLAELRLIASAATKGPYEVVGLDGYGGPYALRMPHRSGRTWYGVEGIKRREDAEYFVAMNRNTVLALLDEIERLQHEVMHLRQRYEALRAAVEDVADLIRGAAEKARQLHFIYRDPYNDGRSVGFGTAVTWLRKALAEHGGDER